MFHYNNKSDMKSKLILISAMLVTSIAVSAQTWSQGTSALYVNPTSTKVGIGVNNPQYKLDVNGKMFLRSVDGSEGMYRSYLHWAAHRLIMGVPAGTTAYTMVDIIPGGCNQEPLYSQLRLFTATAQNVQTPKICLNTMQNCWFDNPGNFGIGTSNPQYKLDVNGKMYLHTVDWRDGMANSYLQWECHRLVMGVRDGFYAHTVVDIMPGGSSQGEVYSQLSMYEALNETTKVEKIKLWTAGDSWINNNSNFGLGTNTPQCKLDVRGTIRADEILVNTVSGADFVFDKDYKLRSLSEVNTYIQENRHLPEIPSAVDMKENGVSLDKLTIQLLQKVEEFTLYIIEQEKRIKEQDERIQELERQIENTQK